MNKMEARLRVLSLCEKMGGTLEELTSIAYENEEYGLLAVTSEVDGNINWLKESFLNVLTVKG